MTSRGIRTRPSNESDAAFFRERFEKQGSRTRAVAEKRYMKSELSFHGVGIPQIRAACSEFLRHETLDHERLVATASALFAGPFHDERCAAIDLLERRRALLSTKDVPWLVSLVRASPGWAHVDWLAAKVIGPLVQDTPRMKRWLEAWARDEDLWVRRTALLAQLVALRGGAGDFALFESIAAPMLPEREFFIRKAIGWVLRETAKKRPALVRAFLARHGEAMSGLTRREAEKGLRASTR